MKSIRTNILSKKSGSRLGTSNIRFIDRGCCFFFEKIERENVI